jgi:hypothetical protein
MDKQDDTTGSGKETDVMIMAVIGVVTEVVIGVMTEGVVAIEFFGPKGNEAVAVP